MEFSSVNQRSTVGSGVLNPCLEPVLQPSLLKRCWKGSFMPSECRKGLHFLCAENVCFLGQPLTILRVRAAPKTPVKNRILNLISRTVFVAFQKTEWAKIWWMKYFQHVSSFKEGGGEAARRRVDLNITLDAVLYWMFVLRDSVIHSVWRKPASPRRPGGWSDSSPAGRSRPAEWRSEVGRCVSEWV